MKVIYYDEIEVYPEPVICSVEHATAGVEVTDEEFERITSAYNAWDKERQIFFARGKKKSFFLPKS